MIFLSHLAELFCKVLFMKGGRPEYFGINPIAMSIEENWIP